MCTGLHHDLIFTGPTVNKGIRYSRLAKQVGRNSHRGDHDRSRNRNRRGCALTKRRLQLSDWRGPHFSAGPDSANVVVLVFTAFCPAGSDRPVETESSDLGPILSAPEDSARQDVVAQEISIVLRRRRCRGRGRGDTRTTPERGRWRSREHRPCRESRGRKSLPAATPPTRHAHRRHVHRTGGPK
jgi:hypothetical protein